MDDGKELSVGKHNPKNAINTSYDIIGTAINRKCFGWSDKNRMLFKPNVNITRKQLSNIPCQSTPSPMGEQGKIKHHSKEKSTKHFTQTKSVFSEGLCCKLRNTANSSCKNVYNKARKREIRSKQQINECVNDCDEKADKTVCLDSTNPPMILPLFSNRIQGLEVASYDHIFQTLNQNVEKRKEIKVENIKNVLGSEQKQLLLFSFPSVLEQKNTILNDYKPKKMKFENACDGQWGTLRIHQNGDSYFVTEGAQLAVTLVDGIHKDVLLSRKTTKERDIINLGSIDNMLICSANIY